MPFGIDTPSLFGMVFGVLGPAMLLTRDPVLAWKIGMGVTVGMGAAEARPRLRRRLGAPDRPARRAARVDRGRRDPAHRILALAEGLRRPARRSGLPRPRPGDAGRWPSAAVGAPGGLRRGARGQRHLLGPLAAGCGRCPSAGRARAGIGAPVADARLGVRARPGPRRICRSPCRSPSPPWWAASTTPSRRARRETSTARGTSC